MSKDFSPKQIHILDVAEKLIARKGYDGTSVRDICAEAKINVAMISYYFGSKEKMMADLYQYRVHKTRESFVLFAETIRMGNPEMQVKELIKYVVSLLFKYSYFHGFVTQELRQTEYLRKEQIDFYNSFTNKLDELIKRGVATGVFHNVPKAEDILTLVIGAALFVIRNESYYKEYISGDKSQYLVHAEKKVLGNLLVTVFSLLGYTAPHKNK